jgi:hypothetical protein
MARRWRRRRIGLAALGDALAERRRQRGWLCGGPGYWLAVPEVTSFVAGSCPAARFHLDEGLLAEIVDGTLVLTARDPTAQRRRYVTEIRGRLAAGPCTCGVLGAVLELP